jgi:hypothetical protein
LIVRLIFALSSCICLVTSVKPVKDTESSKLPGSNEENIKPPVESDNCVLKRVESELPLSLTVAPCKGALRCWSVTVPCILSVCALRPERTKKRAPTNNILLIMILV